MTTALGLVACDDGRTTTGSGNMNVSRGRPVLDPVPDPEWTLEEDEQPSGVAPLDFGEDWETVAQQLRGNRDAAVPPSGVAPGAIENDTWGLVLRTFTGEDAGKAAQTMLGELTKIDPRLSQSWVRTTRKGAMVVFGRYPDPSDAAAQQDLAWLKQLTYGNRVVFGRVMIGNVTDQTRRRWRPIELMSVRLRYPDVDPLYTMQVAVWGSFEGAMQWEDAKRTAEGYASELRTAGHAAFVHHDGAKQLSMVTVGLFDRGALDPQSGLFRADVETVLASFPAHLVNGEPLEIALDGRDPSRGTKKQLPMLVFVPELD
jgi:hypothetical protein